MPGLGFGSAGGGGDSLTSPLCQPRASAASSTLLQVCVCWLDTDALCER